ncbi:hypothetical protein CDAR_241531 [Caerostris darwini]|uniref:Uncharacterized protein n=1 Tax=Caerostris darwini TaxID=1538125 RepID=A0AAV4QFR1_9ARAC|nr:hypothetical protein CDAR_241531 [Caerostris darwini]
MCKEVIPTTHCSSGTKSPDLHAISNRLNAFLERLLPGSGDGGGGKMEASPSFHQSPLMKSRLGILISGAVGWANKELQEFSVES